MNKTEYQEQIQLQSTELLFLESELAGIGGRALAYSIDGVVRIAGFLLLFWASSPVLGKSHGASAAIIGTLLLLNFSYYIVIEWLLSGKTPGKYVAGIRVIKHDGTAISFLDSFLRNVLRMADFLPFGYVAGIGVMFFDGQNRRIGDIIADTTVIYDRPKHRDLAAFLDSQILTQEANPLCRVRGVEKLGDAEKTIVKNLFSRIDTLGQDERYSILDKFNKTIVPKVSVEGSSDPEVILYEIYKQL